MSVRVMEFKGGRLIILDQTKLPLREARIECSTVQRVWKALRRLQVRGAPLIGAFACYGVYVGVKDFHGKKTSEFIKHARKVIAYLRTSRPTAVNLFWALQHMEDVLTANRLLPVEALKQRLLQEAHQVNAEEIKRCDAIAAYGVSLIQSKDRILTHCNAGMLATSGAGTALSVIYAAHKKYRDITVYSDETRPLLQGARLTCWELLKNGIKPILICDNMAGSLMRQKKIDKVIVGADRIAANGDAANKIGTYPLAVLCKHHGIPFYIAAPMNTFDMSLSSGDLIPIEERDAEEVRTCFGRKIAPQGVAVCNPAFDVTPHAFISAIITDKGVLYPPFTESIRRVL